ncbi:hypothetical protein D3C78_1291470 [compost metagenome]
MQPAAFLALHGAADDQLRHLHQIAQFQQVVGDAEVGIVLVNFCLQGIDAAQCALQPFGGAHYPYVVPHKQSKLMPVMLDHHAFVGVVNPAFIPLWQLFRQLDKRQTHHDVFRR